MRNTDESRFVLKIYLAVVYLIANFMGACTYLAFGNNTDEIVFKNFKEEVNFFNY